MRTGLPNVFRGQEAEKLANALGEKNESQLIVRDMLIIRHLMLRNEQRCRKAGVS